MFVARRLKNRRNHIRDRLVAYIIDLKDDFTKLTTLNRPILIVVDETCIMYLQRRCISEPFCDPLYTRMLWHTSLGLLCTVIAGIITRLKVIDSVVVIVATVKATAINRRVRNRFLITLRFTILIVITRDNCLSITVLIRNAIAVNWSSTWHITNA